MPNNTSLNNFVVRIRQNDGWHPIIGPATGDTYGIVKLYDSPANIDAATGKTALTPAALLVEYKATISSIGKSLVKIVIKRSLLRLFKISKTVSLMKSFLYSLPKSSRTKIGTLE